MALVTACTKLRSSKLAVSMVTYDDLANPCVQLLAYEATGGVYTNCLLS